MISHIGSRWALVAVLCFAVLVAACGDDDAAEAERETDTPHASAPDPTGAGPSADAEPTGVVRVGYDLVSAAKGGFTWDPAQIKTQLTDDALLYLVYGRLLRRTPDGGLVPDLAERTGVIDDTTIEIVLREGLTFHDGVPFDAEVVKEGLERNLALTESPGPGRSFFDARSVAVTGPHRLTVTVPNGSAASWHDTYLASWETTIVREDTDFGSPVGAGPMRLVRFVPEESIVLERYEDYWEADAVTVAGLELVHVPGSAPQSALAALQAGQIDLATTESNLVRALRSPLEAVVTTDPNQLATFQVCKRDGPLAEVDARRAINKAIDRQALVDAVLEGAGEPATSLWPAGHRFHNPDVADELAYDPDGARSLLRRAGLADGFEFDLHVIQAAAMPDTAEVIQQQLAAVGITADIVPASNYVEDFLVSQRPGAGLVPTMSPNRLKVLQWSGERIGNACTYHDPELESLQAELGKVSDASDEAIDVWHRIEEKAVEDALSVFLFFGARTAVYDSDRLTDVVLWPDVITMPDVRGTRVRAEG